MKKIISILSIFAMVATMFTNVAFADDSNYFEWKEVAGQVTDESVTLQLHLKTGAASSVEIIGFSIKVPEELTAADIQIKDGMYLKGLAFENGYLSYAATGVMPILTTLGEIATVTFNVKNLKNDFTLTCTPEGANDGAAEASKDLYSMKPYTLKAPVTGPSLVENPYVFSFTADEETDIKIINSRTGDKTYDLPDFVDGTANVWGLLKFSGKEDVQAGDTFTIKTAKNRVELETIKTITVQAADLQ